VPSPGAQAVEIGEADLAGAALPLGAVRRAAGR
jgi:hypothetical protein